ncbi:hypothetical protein [Methylobacterium sp. GC_Met_2]|uniref:hypothetical protein n=1 Tax=Methylobacterium sp. GC_Met_2 TaxID=2937376 RepID=UPI00226B6F50|nr:hypothetical protein [Methylobacterium sp. GC_Met_2]
MPHIRIVDYVANQGGGLRFVVELVGKLLKIPGHSFDLVSGGQALERYIEVFNEKKISIQIFKDEIAPTKAANGSPFLVPDVVGADADLIWLPWAHRHLISELLAKKTVATIHDVILLRHQNKIMPLLDEFTRKIVARIIDGETAVLSQLLNWRVPIALSSHSTQTDLLTLFGQAGQSNLVPLAGDHKALETDSVVSLVGLPDRYIICPATVFPHKNHIALITALGRCSKRLPLMLTGPGTSELPKSTSGYGGHINSAVANAGLVWAEDVWGLGMLPDPIYGAVLRRAELLVMPTLGEGGGQFPRIGGANDRSSCCLFRHPRYA